MRWWCSTVSRWLISSRSRSKLAQSTRLLKATDIGAVVDRHLQRVLPRRGQHLVGRKHPAGDTETLHVVTVERPAR